MTIPKVLVESGWLRTVGLCATFAISLVIHKTWGDEVPFIFYVLIGWIAGSLFVVPKGESE